MNNRFYHKCAIHQMLFLASPIGDGSYRAKRKDIEMTILALGNKSGDKCLKLTQLAELLGKMRMHLKSII
ncbi:MAG: hypothetical protein HRT51_05805 [Colwellia sp.]|nr:hypothetical protein [Colwellia sp.]